jgi:ornithine cyclodeaminase/alanine dehydrogenase-like protein (mu-crystallin family)
VTLYLTESDVERLAEPADAVPVIEECFRRMAAGEIEIAPRRRLPLDGGVFAFMAATDSGLGRAGTKSYAAVDGKAEFVVCLFELEGGTLEAVLEADKLGQLRTGAASGVAAKYLARPGATSLGLIGCGWQAESQLEAIRHAVPTVEQALAWCRTPSRLAEFCERTGAMPAEGAHEAAACDVVVTVTTSRDPVIRGEWLREGALVCAVGANHPRSRELDAQVIERASFVCCDLIEDAKLESGDLIDPVAAGRLDWLEVHELHEVVVGEVVGREHDGDIVVFKSNGIAAWDVAMAHELVARATARDVGTER